MDKADRLQQYLSLLRNCAGWTAEAFGKKLGVSRQTISTFEREGSHLSTMQYLAIRKVFDDEILNNPQDTDMLAQLIEMLVDHPDKYDDKERQEAVAKSKLMAPSIMKDPSERKAISTAWKAILLASGIVISTAFTCYLHPKDE